MMGIELTEASILRLQPGDVLLVKLDRQVSESEVARFRDTWKAMVEGSHLEHVRVLILQNADVAVLRAEVV